MARAILIILDGVGVGGAPDAAAYGDVGSDTLGNLAREQGGLDLPNLASLGLGNLHDIPGVPPAARPRAATAGCASSRRQGLHDRPLGTHGPGHRAAVPDLPDGFPPEVMAAFERAHRPRLAGQQAPAARRSSTSWATSTSAPASSSSTPRADSVFQIAAHEDVVPLTSSTDLRDGPAAAGAAAPRSAASSRGRSSARPATTRAPTNRRDFSVPPPGPTVLDALREPACACTTIGKIYDLFAGRGIDATVTSRTTPTACACRRALRAAGAGPGFFMPTWSTSTCSAATATTPPAWRGGLRAFDALAGEFPAAAARRRPAVHHRRPRQRPHHAEHRPLPRGECRCWPLLGGAAAAVAIWACARASPTSAPRFRTFFGRRSGPVGRSFLDRSPTRKGPS